MQVERQGKEAKRRSNLEEHAESRESNHANDLIDDLHAIFVRGLKVDLINLYYVWIFDEIKMRIVILKNINSKFG